MEAGPELDDLIATRVMGQKLVRDCPLGDEDCWGKYEPMMGRWPCLPPYSTDIAAAWLVVEHMVHQMGYDNRSFKWEGPLFKPEHRYMTEEGYPLGTTCWYVYTEHKGRRRWACANTAQLAICRAALAVVGAEVPAYHGHGIPTQ